MLASGIELLELRQPKTTSRTDCGRDDDGSLDAHEDGHGGGGRGCGCGRRPHYKMDTSRIADEPLPPSSCTGGKRRLAGAVGRPVGADGVDIESIDVVVRWS